MFDDWSRKLFYCRWYALLWVSLASPHTPSHFGYSCKGFGKVWQMHNFGRAAACVEAGLPGSAVHYICNKLFLFTIAPGCLLVYALEELAAIM